jgi:hypothetical protein
MGVYGSSQKVEPGGCGGGGEMGGESVVDHGDDGGSWYDNVAVHRYGS